MQPCSPDGVNPLRTLAFFMMRMVMTSSEMQVAPDPQNSGYHTEPKTF